jgi:hypothetical protein
MLAIAPKETIMKDAIFLIIIKGKKLFTIIAQTNFLLQGHIFSTMYHIVVE